MKYVIAGELLSTDDTPIKGVINKYRSLDKESITPGERDGKPCFIFEIKTTDETKRRNAFADFKKQVGTHKGRVNWHKCHHDEADNQPCVLEEEYVVE